MKKTYSIKDKIIIWICFIIFVMSATWLIEAKVDAWINKEEMEELSNTVKMSENVVPVDKPPKMASKDIDKTNVKSKDDISNFSQINKKSIIEKENQEMLPRFKELYKRNSDIYGWISIFGTNINYPVMFTPKDEEYYLRLNFDKEYEKRGLPFLDGKTNIKQSKNYLIYGHNMKDGTAFADLINYSNEEYYKKHPIIHFSTLYEEHDYEILSAFYSQIYYKNQDTFKYYQYENILNKSQYDQYVESIKELSLYNTDIMAEYGNQIISLSTCSYHVEDGRFVVVAVCKK